MLVCIWSTVTINIYRYNDTISNYILQIHMEQLSGWFVFDHWYVIVLTTSACRTSVLIRHITKRTEDVTHWSTCWLCWSWLCEDKIKIDVYWVTFSPMLSHWGCYFGMGCRDQILIEKFAHNCWFIGLFFIKFDIAHVLWFIEHNMSHHIHAQLSSMYRFFKK